MVEQEDVKEQRIRKITHLYYSRKDVQKALFSFSSGRETVPRYFEGFGKRPDSFQYPGDIFELVKRGATSFHCSEEIWSDPLKLSTGMNEKQLNQLRVGWDLLLDIDSKYLDYSKVMAEKIIKVLNFHGVKNIGIKFSGSKGFHIIVPWKAFPDSIHDNKTSEMFPEWPRIITKYIMDRVKGEVTKKINELHYSNNQFSFAQRYIKREGGSEDVAGGVGEGKERHGNSIVDVKNKSIPSKFEAIESKKESWNDQVLPDLILVSPRHLFRMPYSLHEKTALASVVLRPEEILSFQPKDADPLKAQVRDFMPATQGGEASELLREALDWYRTHHHPDEKTAESKSREGKTYKPLVLKDISEKNFPPSIQQILLGIKGDGRKRALFVVMNFLRAIGMDRRDIETKLQEWNARNEIPLKEGYIKAQVFSSYKGKAIPPPNYDKDYYKVLGVIPTEEELRARNPVSYMARKAFNKDAREKSPRAPQANSEKARHKKPRE